jgi:hypothetical protein
MDQIRRAYLTTLPSNLNLGSNCVGARIQGSVQVLGATSCDRFYSLECGDGSACAKTPIPDWIELRGPKKTRQQGLAESATAVL